jgi:hypothetical protein
MQFRILPSLRKYATAQLRQQTHRKRKPSSPSTATIITACHVKHHRMCTHYAPLEKGDAFLLGQLSTNEYVKSYQHPNHYMKQFCKHFNGVVVVAVLAVKNFKEESETSDRESSAFCFAY